MNRTSILAGAGAFALGLSLAVCVVPVVAQGSNAKGGGFAIDRDNLPKVKPYKAPLQLEIVDDAPIVKDRRERRVNQVYQLQIDPLGPEETQTSVIRVPGSTVSGADTKSVSTPGTVTFDPSQPPRARFGTNIPSGGIGPSNNLPDGTTTNRMMGVSAARGKMNAPTTVHKKGELLRNSTKSSIAPTPVMTYQDNEGVAKGSAVVEKNIKTNVTGTMKTQVKRGEYLKPPQ